MQQLFPQSELHRRLRTSNQLGRVVAINRDANTAQVQIGDELTTDFLPLPAQYGSCFTLHMPVAVGSKALIIAPNGETTNAVIAAIYHNDANPVAATSDTDLQLALADGSRVHFDTQAKTITVDAAGDLIANVKGHASVDAAGDVAINGARVNLNKNGSGVVTAQSVCHFTGTPHGDASANVFAKK